MPKAPDQFCKKTAPTAGQSGENDYFNLAEIAAMSEAWKFFTAD
jgi:hypothetical protein